MEKFKKRLWNLKKRRRKEKVAGKNEEARRTGKMIAQSANH